MDDSRSIEIVAKKPEDAIKQGLEQLGVTLDDVKVEVLETGGLFRKAKVRLTVEREEEKPAAKKSDEPHVAARTEKREAEKKPESKPVEKTEKTVTAADAEKSDKKHTEKKAEKKPAEKLDSAKPAKRSAKPRNEKKTVNGKNELAQAASNEEPAQEESVAEQQRKDDRARRQKQPRKDEQSQQRDDVRPERSHAPKPRKLREEEREALARALEFVKGTLEKMGFDATVEADAEDPEKIYVTAEDGDDSLIIGRHGETLSALSYLAETAERAEKCKVNVTVDCNGYRARRAASLTAMARRRAKECAQRHRKIKLEPMDRVDRRTVHFALSDNNRVTTASEGKEPYRCVVIFPKDDRRREESHSNDDRDASEYED